MPRSEVERCRAEQRRCRDWLAQHGHDAGVNGEDSRGARLGCSDWLMEELLTNMIKPRKNERLQAALDHALTAWQICDLLDFAKHRADEALAKTHSDVEAIIRKQIDWNDVMCEDQYSVDEFLKGIKIGEISCQKP